MVKTLSERLQAFFTGCKEGSPVHSREQVNELLRACKRVRGKDYVFPFSMPNGGNSNEIIVTSTANDFLYKIKYLSFFVTRAFLLAILGLLVIIAILLAIYYGDMFINVKTGNYNSPIFN